MADIQSNLAPPNLTRPGALLREQLAQFALVTLAMGMAVLGLAWCLVGASPAALSLALGGHLAGSALAIVLLRRGYPHGDLGLCNLVTLARLALAAALLAPLLAPASSWAILGVAVAALAFDGVDGWLARRADRETAFGARLDVEVDAAFGLILALNAWASGTVGIGVLLLGLPRYAYMAAALVFRWMARPLPDRFDRKLVCVVQIAVLIALQAPFVHGWAATVLVAGTALALGWSFGRDLLWLRRTRP